MDFFDWETGPRILFFSAVFLVAMLPTLWQLWMTFGSESPRTVWMGLTGLLWFVSFAPVVIGSSILDEPNRTWFNAVCWVGLTAAAGAIVSALLHGFLSDSHAEPGFPDSLSATVAVPSFPSPEPIAPQTMVAKEQPVTGVKADAYLFVKSGPDGGKQFPIVQSTTIGRAASCEIRLDDRRVSSQHAQVKRSGDQFIFTDLQSSNGSFLAVAGREETIRTPQTLVDGDMVRVGHTVFEFIDSNRRSSR